MEQKIERGKKRTLDQVAKDCGVSRGELDRAKEDGVNPYDSVAVAKWKADRNSYTRSDVPAEIPPDESPRLALEQIEDYASRAGQSKKEIDVYKGQLEVMKAADALRVQRNKLISRAEKEESDAKIAHAVSAMLRKFEKEIPLLCFGQHDIGKVKQVVINSTREIQNAVADGHAEFWKDHPEG